jgi:hypothetical protein
LFEQFVHYAGYNSAAVPKLQYARNATFDRYMCANKHINQTQELLLLIPTHIMISQEQVRKCKNKDLAQEIVIEHEKEDIKSLMIIFAFIIHERLDPHSELYL